MPRILRTLEIVDEGPICPPPPDCSMYMPFCPNGVYTPIDEHGCVTGCKKCVPDIDTDICNLAELCDPQENIICYNTPTCENGKGIYSVKYCSSDDCLYVEEEPGSFVAIEPCSSDHCIGVETLTNWKFDLNNSMVDSGGNNVTTINYHIYTTNSTDGSYVTRTELYVGLCGTIFVCMALMLCMVKLWRMVYKIKPKDEEVQDSWSLNPVKKN